MSQYEVIAIGQLGREIVLGQFATFAEAAQRRGQRREAKLHEAVLISHPDHEGWLEHDPTEPDEDFTHEEET